MIRLNSGADRKWLHTQLFDGMHPQVLGLFEVNRAGRLFWLFPVGVGGCMPSVCVVAG